MTPNNGNRNRTILFTTAVIFTAVIAFFAWDMARHTTRRGSKAQLKERISEEVKK
jgi:hypothetical protein